MRTLAAVVVLFLGAMTIAGAADKTISDDEIYDKVRLKLISDTVVKGGRIEVKVTNGVVELTGTVREEKARTKAEKLTRKVKGVRSVVNNLKISTT
jgi:osmotically-inducible protein OsmY